MGLRGFREAVVGWNRMQLGGSGTEQLTSPWFNDDPMIYVFNAVQIAYPAMSLSYLINMRDETSLLNPADELSATGSEDHVTDGLIVDDAKYVKEYIRSGSSYGGRKDFVLVKRSTTGARDQQPRMHWRNTSMTHRRVAQVLLLFKCNRGAMDMISAHRGSDVGEYAYVQWMNTVEGRPDKDNGMYTLRRTRQMAVIDVDDIERSVHLIPSFRTL